MGSPDYGKREELGFGGPPVERRDLGLTEPALPITKVASEIGDYVTKEDLKKVASTILNNELLSALRAEAGKSYGFSLTQPDVSVVLPWAAPLDVKESSRL